MSGKQYSINYYFKFLLAAKILIHIMISHGVYYCPSLLHPLFKPWL